MNSKMTHSQQHKEATWSLQWPNSFPRCIFWLLAHFSSHGRQIAGMSPGAFSNALSMVLKAMLCRKSHYIAFPNTPAPQTTYRQRVQKQCCICLASSGKIGIYNMYKNKVTLELSVLIPTVISLSYKVWKTRIERSCSCCCALLTVVG